MADVSIPPERFHLKAMWVVTAGVIPGQPLAELERIFHYTQEEDLADAEAAQGPAQTYTNRFTLRMAEAFAYAAALQAPARLNWVKVEWVWL